MAHPDLDDLLSELLPFAQDMLAKHGEFFPYGSAMTKSGEIVAHAAHDGAEQPPSQQLIDMLTAGFRKKAAAGEIRAAGICYDARIVPPDQEEKTDAICVSLEHESGEATEVYMPYKKGWLGRIKYGDIFAEPREPQFFPKK